MRKAVLHGMAGTGNRRKFQALRIFAIPGLGEIFPGDDLAQIIADAAGSAKIGFEAGDILVVAQKIISKAEGSILRLADIHPSPAARSLATKLKNDPRFIEVVLQESRRIVRRGPRALIVETHHGFVCANAGVDRSNVRGRDSVTLLPREPDRSARNLAASLRKHTGKRVAVVISDTFGRPWRMGLTNVAIGAAGVPPLLDLRGKRDRTGRTMHATIQAVADELAAAAGLLMLKAAGLPVVLIRGYRFRAALTPASIMIRPPEEDLFR